MMGLKEEKFLTALTAPRSVAIVGASANSTKLTARPIRFLQKNGFEGKIYPVNPVRDEVMGLKAYPSVRDIPDAVDCAYILLDADAAVEVVADCAAKGVVVVAVLADGFAEAGPEGMARQAKLARIAEEAGIMLIGPNSTGIVSTASGFVCTTNAAFAADDIGRGHTAVLSQSGSIIGTLLSRGQERGHRYSTLVSVGNEARCGVGDVGLGLLDDPNTKAFQLFLETIRDTDALERFARGAAKRGKPVVAYAIGMSEEGRALAVSHTGALTGGRETMSAFLREIGIQEVTQFDTLIEAPVALSRSRLSTHRPRCATVLSTTGGGGAMVIDQLSTRGVEISGISEASRAHLTALDIPLGQGKLVDVTLAGTKYDPMKAVVDTLIRDPETGILVVAVGSSAQFNPELSVAPIIDAVKAAPESAAPVVAFPLPHAPESLGLLEEAGVSNFHNLETCAETVALMLRPAVTPRKKVPALPDTLEEALASIEVGTLSEVESGVLLENLGIRRPASILLGADDPIPQHLNLTFPLAAKLVSADLPHKSEAGAVSLGIENHDELVHAISEMRASAKAYAPDYHLEGVLVQEMRLGLGEAILGITRDPLVGPVITVGLGGILTELYRDTAVRRAPVDVETARAMISEVKGFEALNGYRGKAKGDLEALAKCVSNFSRLALNDRVAEAEVNPIAVMRECEGVMMLDALVRLRE